MEALLRCQEQHFFLVVVVGKLNQKVIMSMEHTSTSPLPQDLYAIRCILPHDRYVHVAQAKVLPLDEQQNEDIYAQVETYLQESTILYYGDGKQSERKSYASLAEMFGFQYVSHLVFLHEKELRAVFMSRPDQDVPTESSLHIEHMQMYGNDHLRMLVNVGFIHPSMSVRHIGLLDGVDVGHGVFAESDLPAGTFLGEYVGMVLSSSSTTQFSDSMHEHLEQGCKDDMAYTCQYPSCDGGLGINATEYGNMIRFMNHSARSNAELRHYWGMGGIMHVLCVSSSLSSILRHG